MEENDALCNIAFSCLAGSCPSVESYPHGMVSVGAIIDLIIVSKPCKTFFQYTIP